MRIFSNYIKSTRDELKDIKEYFEKCREEIDRSNLFMLRRISVYTAVIFIAMCVLSYFFVPEFKITAGHLLFVPVLTIFIIISSCIKKGDNITELKVKAVCVSYYTLMCGIFIALDLSFTERPIIWLPMAIMVFPVIYIDRLQLYLLEETVAVGIYLFLAFQRKAQMQFIWDTYMMLSAYFVSLIIGWIILDVRCKEGLALEEIRRLSQVDKLTKVLNKGTLITKIDICLKHRSEDAPCAMCIIDVDNFKQVNDGLGHKKGDALLEHLGELLLKNFRPTDIVGRFGGDEFVVFMPNMKEISQVESRCRSLQKMLGDYMIDENRPFTLSIGAIVDEGNHSREEMFLIADDALYMSKMSGKNKCSCWLVKKDYKLAKPGLVFLKTIDNSNSQLLHQEVAEQFDIFTCNDNSEALSYVSQYHSDIKMVVVELNSENQMGSFVIRYIKERESFRSIPVLAVADSDEAASMAEELGADKVLKTDTPKEIFAAAIKEL